MASKPIKLNEVNLKLHQVSSLSKLGSISLMNHVGGIEVNKPNDLDLGCIMNLLDAIKDASDVALSLLQDVEINQSKTEAQQN